MATMLPSPTSAGISNLQLRFPRLVALDTWKSRRISEEKQGALLSTFRFSSLPGLSGPRLTSCFHALKNPTLASDAQVKLRKQQNYKHGQTNITDAGYHD